MMGVPPAGAERESFCLSQSFVHLTVKIIPFFTLPIISLDLVLFFDTMRNMNATHRKTLTAVFAEPVSASLEWRRIEALLVAVGCRVIEGNGSRVRFEKDGVVAAFHRPHPAKEAKPYQVRDARHYLETLGVRP